VKIFHILILFICCSFLEAQNNHSELFGTWVFESMTTITNAAREEITIVYKDKKNIETLSFNFKQKIAEKEEIGNCFIKYPLLMKCNYQNLKQKIIISNGKTVAIIKKKYKKIYYYPLKSTPLFFILEKEQIINLIRKYQPTEINKDLIKFEFIDKKKNKLKILFDKNSLNF